MAQAIASKISSNRALSTNIGVYLGAVSRPAGASHQLVCEPRWEPLLEHGRSWVNPIFT